jgi:hypothetical protein
MRAVAIELIQSFKTCRKCGEGKPATAEFFHRQAGRLRSQCKPCALVTAAERRATPTDETRAKQRAYDAARYIANKERRQVLSAAWRAANPDHEKRLGREWNRRKRRDPAFRLKSNIRCYVYASLSRNKGGHRTEALLGYSIEALRTHLERQFLPGMSWDNYGEWHVDHILPVASFDFQTSDDPDFRACWALTNLRPLWGEDNVRKADKRLLLI